MGELYLIIPYIGSMEMQKLNPYHMENLYTTLSKTPCGSYIEGKKQELTAKQKQRFLSGTTIHLHDLCTERGIEEVAESAGGRREERPGTLP